MGIIGHQILIDLIGVDTSICLDSELWLNSFESICMKYGFTVIDKNSHVFKNPQQPGLTAFLLLDSSHFSVHTYADQGIAAVDLFACTNLPLDNLVNDLLTILKIPDKCVTDYQSFGRFLK